MPAPKTRWEEGVDRAMKACTRTFGDGKDPDTGLPTMVYTHASGESYPIDGIFEATTEAIDLDTGAPVTSYQPRVTFALSDMQKIPDTGDTCIIRGKTYRVVDPGFDGQGTVTLRLHEA